MALRMKLKFDKHRGESNLLMALGAPLETVYKLVIIGFCFPEIYGEDAEENIAMVREFLYELYNEYVAMQYAAKHYRSLFS